MILSLTDLSPWWEKKLTKRPMYGIYITYIYKVYSTLYKEGIRTAVLNYMNILLVYSQKVLVNTIQNVKTKGLQEHQYGTEMGAGVQSMYMQFDV